MIEKLSERVERLEGPDREIDLEIARLQNSIVMRRNAGNTANEEYTHWHYTASLDAAMSLVPEGWGVMLHVSENGLHSNVCLARSYPTNLAAYGEAKSLALAICAAALKARGL